MPEADANGVFYRADPDSMHSYTALAPVLLLAPSDALAHLRGEGGT